MIMKRLQNKNIVPAALAGRRLKNGWDHNLGQLSGTFDKRKLEDLWLAPQWSAKVNSDNIVQSARLGIFGQEKKADE